MYKLNEAMKFLIEKKIEEDDKWKKLKIVFSGSDVPGNILIINF
jgi:5'-3' exonuclease